MSPEWKITVRRGQSSVYLLANDAYQRWIELLSNDGFSVFVQIEITNLFLGYNIIEWNQQT